MEDFFDNNDEPASGIYIDIDDYLENKFNFPGTDGIPAVKSASGFEQWLNDKFNT